MPLTREQTEEIEEIYRERRRAAREQARAKRQAVLSALPAWEKLDQERLALAVQRGRAAISGDPEKARELQEKMQDLSRRKEELLKAEGVDLEAIEPVYVCPVCRDTGWVGSESCACRRRLIAQRFFSSSALWNQTRAETFDRFSLEWYDDKKPLPAFENRTARQVMEANLRAARGFADGFGKRGGNLMLVGPTGTGKTFMAGCIARELLEQGYSVQYVTAKECFDIIEAIAFDREKKDLSFEEQLRTADLLIIDDLGTEFTSRTLAQSALYTILNERLLSGRSTIISSNMDINDIKQRYSDRVFSRLWNFTTLRFTGDDIRLKRRLLR